MRSLLLVALGGSVGAVARVLLSTAVQTRWPAALPWGTIVVNLAGCLALGVLAGLLATRPRFAETWRTFGAVGVLGAFTTFSTFEAETLALIERGALLTAAGNLAVSLVAGLVALWMGQAVGRLL